MFQNLSEQMRKMSTDNALTKKVLRSGLIIVFFSLLTSPLGYFVRMLLSRSLSVADYGLLYAVLSFFGIFTIVNDFGFGYATSYFIPKYLIQKKYNLCWLLYKYDQIIEFISSILLSIVFILLDDYLAIHFFKVPEAKELIFLFSLYLIANGLISSIQHLLIGLQSNVYYSAIEFLRLLFTFCFSLFFYVYDFSSVRYYAVAFVAAYFLLILVYLLLINTKFSHLKSRLVWNPELFNRAVTYALPTFLTASLYVFIGHIDVLFLTYFQDVKSVGIYNIAFPIVSISTILLQPIQKMILPLVSELSENNKTKLEILMHQLLKLVPFISIYFALFVFMFSKGIISMMFGYKWVETAVLPLKVMAIAYSMSLLNIYLTSVVAGLGAVRERLRVAVILLFLSVLTGIVGAKYFDVVGIIVANAVVFISSIYLMFRIVQKRIKIVVPYLFYGKLLLFSGLLLVIREQFAYNPIAISHIIFWGIVYSVLMFFVAIKMKALDFKLFASLFTNKLLSFRWFQRFNGLILRFPKV